jgi:hypothetical protein
VPSTQNANNGTVKKINDVSWRDFEHESTDGIET